jgi:hypothetical protein
VIAQQSSVNCDRTVENVKSVKDVGTVKDVQIVKAVEIVEAGEVVESVQHVRIQPPSLKLRRAKEDRRQKTA